MSDSVRSALAKAARGLSFMSEKDAAFKVVVLSGEGELSKENIAQRTGQPVAALVAEEKFDRLFGELCREQKWHGDQEKANVKRFQHLRDVLKEHLTHLRVFKIGTANLKVYIVGKTQKGQWLGLETEALET